MSTPIVVVSVRGLPRTEGSTRPFVRGGKAVVVHDQAGKLRPWRDAVRYAIADQLGADWQPWAGPCSARLVFALPRPQRPPSPFPTGKRSGDLDKLARAVLDAATDAGLWLDDAQVVDLSATKAYAGNGYPMPAPGLHATFTTVDQEDPR